MERDVVYLAAMAEQFAFFLQRRYRPKPRLGASAGSTIEGAVPREASSHDVADIPELRGRHFVGKVTLSLGLELFLYP